MWHANVCSDHQKFMHSFKQQLKQLISVTPNLYQILYLALLNKLEHDLKKQDAQNMFLSAFTHAINALKVRRGVMLPIGSDAETCYREQEVWTYAIFTAVLLKEAKQALMPKQHSESKDKNDFEYKNLEKFLPKNGLTWLKSYHVLFEHWSNYLSNNTNKNNFILYVVEKLKTGKTEETEETEKEAKTANTIVLFNEDVSRNSTELMTTQNIADQFIIWLTQSIQMNTISFNQADSCLHHVSEGLFILMPETLVLFIENTLPYKPVFKKLDNTKARRKYIRSLWQELTQADLFIQAISIDNLLKGLLIQNNALYETTKILSDLFMPVRNDLQIKLLATNVR